MSLPTGLSVYVDRREYSRLEDGRDTIRISVRPTGTGLAASQVDVSLVKARRARDVAVATKRVTLTNDAPFGTSFFLPDLVDATLAIPLVREGKYFVRVAVVGSSTKGESADFRVTKLTVEGMRKTFLLGADGRAVDLLLVYRQPQKMAVEIIAVTKGHPQTFAPLVYQGPVGKQLYAGAAGAGASATTIPWTGPSLPDVSGKRFVFNGRSYIVDTNNASSVKVLNPGIIGALPVEGATLAIHESQERALSWFGGPLVPIGDGSLPLILRAGTRDPRAPSDHFVEAKVTVANLEDLPQNNVTEDLCIFGAPMPDEDIRRMIDQSFSDIEQVQLDVYLEPTRVTTKIVAGVVSAGSTVPSFAGSGAVNSDWDEIVDAVTHEQPGQSCEFVLIDLPQVPLLKVEALAGEWVGKKIVEVPLEWIQAHNAGGLVQLVPYFAPTSFEMAGYQYGLTMRGATSLPNFWHYTALVGFRDTPQVLLEYGARLAAHKILGMFAQASFNSISNKSISKGGVSQSVSYTTSAMYGIFSATQIDHKKWCDEHADPLRQRFHGLQGGTFP